VAVRNSKRNNLKLKILSQLLNKGVPVITEVMVELKGEFTNLVSFASTEVIRGTDALLFSKAYKMAEEDARLTEESEETDETEDTTFSSTQETKDSSNAWNASSSNSMW